MEASAVEAVTESTELTSLFVGDLSIFCGESDMLRVFEPFGGLVDVKIMRCDETHKNLCYGFVKYDNQDNAAKAMDSLNGNLLCGRPMRISWAAHRSGGGNRPFMMQPKLSSDQQFANTSSVHVAYSTVQTDELITEASLRDVFSEYGEIHDITIKKYEMDPRHRLQRGYGFVHYPATEEGIEAAVRCAKELKDRVVNGIHYKCDISHKLLRQLRVKEGGSGSSESMTTVEGGSSSEAESTPTPTGPSSGHRMLSRRNSRNNSSFNSNFGSFRNANSRSSEFFSSSQSSELMDTTNMPSMMNVQRSTSFDFDASQQGHHAANSGGARYYHGVPSPVEYGAQPFFLPIMYPPMVDANGMCYDPMTGAPMGYYGYAPNGAAAMYHQQQQHHMHVSGADGGEKNAKEAGNKKGNGETPEPAANHHAPEGYGSVAQAHQQQHQQYQYYFPNGAGGNQANVNMNQGGGAHHQHQQQQQAAAYTSEAHFTGANAGNKYYTAGGGNNAQQQQGYQPPLSPQNLPPLPPLLWTGSEMIAAQQQHQQNGGGGYVYGGQMPGTPSTMPMPPLQHMAQNYTLTSAQVHIGRPVMPPATAAEAARAAAAGRQYSANSAASAPPSLVTPGTANAPMMRRMVFSPPNAGILNGAGGGGGGQPQQQAIAWSRSASVGGAASGAASGQQQQTGCA